MTTGELVARGGAAVEAVHDDGSGAAASSRPDVVARSVDRWIGLGIVVACCAFVYWKLHPELLWRDTTTNGGDMGAHVWMPAYLRDHVLPHWRLAGWSPDWYAGFPVGQFYFPVPALLIVLLDVALPYNVAFKLVTAVGPVALPAAAYAFGRGIRAPRPTPVFFSVASVVFLFFKGSARPEDAGTIAFNQHIMGGNLASNLAGEYSFTIALVFALLFLGSLAAALRDHRRFAWPAALLALTVTSHLVVGLFAVTGAVIVWVASRPLRNLRFAAAIGVVGGLLTAVWIVPLVARLGYTTQMRYEKLTDYATYLRPSYLNPAFVLALIGLGAGIAVLRRSTFVLVALAATFYVWFERWPAGHVWNLRFLPFWYLTVFLLAAVGAAELARAPRAIARWVETGSFDPRPRLALRFFAEEPGDSGDDHDLPGDVGRHRRRAWWRTRHERLLSVAITFVMLLVSAIGLVGLHRDNDEHHGFLDYWATWNYTGYESKPGYTEYRQLNETMGKLPPGRAFWERATAGTADTLGAYGGDFALMLLPYWTKGRIGSIEGVYYDGSATTTYYFLMASHLSKNPAGTVRIPPAWKVSYSPALADFAHGVHQMQTLGVRYYMAQSPEAKQLADSDPNLRLVAEVPDLDGAPPSGWKVYEVTSARSVVPLRHEPVVIDAPTSGDDWTRVATKWWEDATALDRPLAASGPAGWKRAKPAVAIDEPRRPLPRVEVRGITTTDDAIAFDVSRPGVPVAVRTSYYPSWRVDGAKGPYRITPNLMVVVPTRTHVELHYGTTGADWLGLVLSTFGLVGLVALALWRPREPGPEVPGPEVPGPEVPGPEVPGPEVPGPAGSGEDIFSEDPALP